MDALFITVPLIVGLSAVFATLGMGGASIYVPIFYFLGIPLESAILAGLFINIITTAISTYTFHRHNLLGEKEYASAFWIFGGIIVGAPIGAFIANAIEPRIIIGIFSLVLLVAAARLQFVVAKKPSAQKAKKGKAKVKDEVEKKKGNGFFGAIGGFFEEIGVKALLVALVRGAAEGWGRVASAAGLPAAAERGAIVAVERSAVGGSTGAISGTLGIGGGIFLVPFLIETGTEPRRAAILSHICTLFSSVIGIAAHVYFGGMAAAKFEFMLWGGAAAAAGSLVGSTLMARGTVSGVQIRSAFVLLLLLLGIKLGLDFFGIGGNPIMFYD